MEFKKEFLPPPLELTYHELIERWGLPDNNSTVKYIADLINNHNLKGLVKSPRGLKKYQPIRLDLSNSLIDAQICGISNLRRDIKIGLRSIQALLFARSECIEYIEESGVTVTDDEFLHTWLMRKLHECINDVQVMIDEGSVGSVFLDAQTSKEIYSALINYVGYEELPNSPIQVQNLLYSEHEGRLRLRIGNMVNDSYIITTYKVEQKSLYSMNIEAPIFDESQLYFAYADIAEFEESLSNKSSNDESRGNDALKSVQKQTERELVLKVAINLGVIKKNHTKAEVHEILTQASPDLFALAKTTFNDFFKKQQLFTLNSGRRSMEDTAKKH
ncbi:MULTISPECIES: hypothetical protein [Cysteiniphilum]|uniref:hypothetical protein n=1 Tax=Cysteiniphilum TaxID=2056696 RepID=UPI0017823A77|nr:MULTISPECIES: hypothetical protein [Cysteiniphilum]